MDAAINYDASSPPASLHSGGPESDFNKSSLSVKTSRDSESTGETVTRFELDVASICEKVTNLNLLSMHVETKESDFEAFVSDMDPDFVTKALEFDLLCGLLGSELRVLETHISDLQKEKANVMEFLSSRKHLGEPIMGMEDMLYDSEKSLEQSLEQVSEIKVRSANFENNLLRFAGDETWTDKDYAESFNTDNQELKEKLKMQTVEHQRHILRMLEKSLEREIDLERKVNESIQIEETLTMRVHLLEQDTHYAEVEAETTLEKLYETDYTSVLLMETSKELLSQIKMLQFNLRGSIQQETQLRSVILKLKERLTECEGQLVNEKASTQVIAEMEDTIKDLRQQIIEAGSMVVLDNHEKVVSLEEEVSDAKNKLQHVEACYEASEEEKNMLLSTIEDMGNVIEDLKKKVSQGVVQIENVEDKCILLSESNADLKKELCFVKGRVKCLETSLHQMEETKKASAKDISLRSKLITDLVMQMALERERLQKQISSLKQENETLVKCLKKTDKGPAVKVSHGNKASSTESKEALSTRLKIEKACNETVRDSTETARNIDARQVKHLTPKDILSLLLILIIPISGVFLFQTLVR